MVRYSFLILSALMIVILGLTSQEYQLLNPLRDPVPVTQKVAHSSHCAGCHGKDETGNALVDNDGNDVSIHDDWQISMMGLSAHDPFWRATLTHEVALFPAAQEDIETTCLKCHAPLGSIESHYAGIQYSFELMLEDSLGLDGVSCSSCHQQPLKDLGKGHSGNFLIDTNRILFGHLPNPVQGPMQIYVGFDPVFSDHIYNSGICAGCHTLITPTLNDDGSPSGDYFVEQATYHEWLNSVYPIQGKECQSCHLPFIKDSVVIATDLLALEKRYPYGLHQFFGANTAMLSMMQINKEELGLPAAPEEAWSESINNNRISLSKAADIDVLFTSIQDDTLYVDLRIKNKTGHKLPSGYPSRISWLQLIMTDVVSHDTMYTNGLLNNIGQIEGRDLPFESHHEISRSEEDVQIYEMVMSDLQGNTTTSLNAAYKPVKDNRIVPLGFRRDHSTYDTVAIWGNAISDPEYDNRSELGSDEIQYRIPLDGRKGIVTLEISLRYHTFPKRWMADIFSNDSLPQVAKFKTMYQGFELYDEEIDEIILEGINLSPSSQKDLHHFEISLFPNPSIGNEVYFNSKSPVVESVKYELVNLKGEVLHSGMLAPVVRLPNLPTGLYYFILYEKKSIISVRPYTVL